MLKKVSVQFKRRSMSLYHITQVTLLICTSRVGQYTLNLSSAPERACVSSDSSPLDCIPEGLQLPWLLQHHRRCRGHFGGEGERREEKVTALSL